MRKNLDKDILILGAGGHASVLAASLHAQNFSIKGCVASSPPNRQYFKKSVPYLGDESILKGFDTEKTCVVIGVGSTKSTRLRQDLAGRVSSLGFQLATIIDPGALVSSHVSIAEGAQIISGSIIQCGVTVGANALVNTGAIVDHDCILGSHCHLAPGVTLSGGVQVGKGAHIGTGASVIQGVTLGEDCFVAAGAAVTQNVPAGASVAGVPARSF